MSYLLDTNVVSEWVRPSPDPGVVAWLDEVDEDRVFLSVVTIAELRHGIERLPPGARRERLAAWLDEELPRRFEARILPIDEAVANAWGRIVARGEASGRPMHAMDAFLAALAETHDLTLVTRNAADFSLLRQPVENPWSGR